MKVTVYDTDLSGQISMANVLEYDRVRSIEETEHGFLTIRTDNYKQSFDLKYHHVEVLVDEANR